MLGLSPNSNGKFKLRQDWPLLPPTGPSYLALLSFSLASPCLSPIYRAQHAPRNVPQHTRPPDPAIRRRHPRPPPQPVLTPPERDTQTDASDLHPLLEHEPRHRQRPSPTRLHQQRHKVRLLLSLSCSSDSSRGGRQRIFLTLTPTLCIFPLCLVCGCLLSPLAHRGPPVRNSTELPRPEAFDSVPSSSQILHLFVLPPPSAFRLVFLRLPSTPRLTPSFLFALLLGLSFACCSLAESSSTAVPSPSSRAPGASQNRAFTSTPPRTNSKDSSTARGSRSTGGSERGRLSLSGRLRGDIWRAGRLWLRGLGGR